MLRRLFAMLIVSLLLVAGSAGAAAAHSSSWCSHTSANWLWVSGSGYWDLKYIGSYNESGVHHHVYKWRPSGLPLAATHMHYPAC